MKIILTTSRLFKSVLSAGFFAAFLSLPSTAASSASATTVDVILLAECGGFFNSYGELIGRSDLSTSGTRLAEKLLGIEQDTRSMAVSYERGGEFADSWHDTNDTGQIVNYIQMCSKVVSRNKVYLQASS